MSDDYQVNRYLFLAIIALLMPFAIWIYKIITDREQREIDSHIDVKTDSDYEYAVVDDTDEEARDVEHKDLSTWPNFSFSFLVHNMMTFENHTAYILRSYEFSDDEEAHDDELQDRLEAEFKDCCRKLLPEIDQILGDHTEVEHEDMQAYFGPTIEFQWRKDNRLFYLAASHEDREDPNLIHFGVKKMKKIRKV